MSRHARGAVAEHGLARGRPEAVGADQRRALVLGAVLADDPDDAAFLLETLDVPRGFERDLVARLAGRQQPAVQVAAVDDEVAELVAREESLAERDAADFLVGKRIDEDQRFRIHRTGLERLQHAEAIEHARDVRPHLDAVADLAELGRLLQHAHLAALLRERERRGEAADAAAGNEDFLHIFSTAGSQ